MLSKRSSVILSAVFIALLTSTSFISLAGDKSLEAGSPSNKTKGDNSWIKSPPEKTSAQSAADKARADRMEEMRKAMAKAKEEATAKDTETSKPAAKVEETKKPAEEPKTPSVDSPTKPAHKVPALTKKEDQSSLDFHKQKLREQIARNKLKKQEELLKLQEANKAKKAADAAKPATVKEHEKVTLKLPESALKVEQHPDLVMTQHPDKVEVKSKSASADEEAKVEAKEMHRSPAMKKAMERSSGSHAPKASPGEATPNPEIVITHAPETLKSSEPAKKPLEMKVHPEMEMKTHPDKVEKVTNLKLPESALKVEQHPDTVEKVTNLKLPESALKVEQHPDTVEKVTNLKLPESALKVEQHPDKVEVSSVPVPPKKPEVGTENTKPKLTLMEEIRNRKGRTKPEPSEAPKETPPAA